MTVRDLPTVNAALNATSAVLLMTGWWLIRSGKRQQHRWVMTAALCTSTAFLICYLLYHYLAQQLSIGVVRFQKPGAIRTVYLTILFTHTVLAAAVPPLAIITLSRALKAKFDRHRRIARWTLPIWLYVSVTGVVIYWMLYRM